MGGNGGSSSSSFAAASSGTTLGTNAAFGEASFSFKRSERFGAIRVRPLRLAGPDLGAALARWPKSTRQIENAPTVRHT